VAIFPPVSGGTDTPPTIVRITENVLDMNAVLESILLPTTGATCVLTDLAKGRVSPEQFDGTANLPSDAHPPVVEESLKQVVEEMRTKWPSLEGIALIQRTGQIEPGTPTVLVACSAAFRDESVFEAARYGIDRLRDIAPT
jgi:molybdopterin synthase catalytic subunit